MALAEGVIGYVNYKKFPKAKAPVWSFALEGEDGVYYSCGFDKPCRPGTDDAIEEGDEVKFQWEEDDYGNKVNMKRFKVTKVGPGKKKAKGGGKGGSGGNKDEYWAEKDRFDKEVSLPLLQYRFALATAKDLVIEATKMEVLPKAKSKAGALDLLVEQTEEMANKIFDLTTAKYEELKGTPATTEDESLVVNGEEMSESDDWDDDDDDEWDE